ncbi:protein-glutamate methylesterase/protein-glutamine glutaminase [Desulfuribacillus alkaliarsenatis]|uniref:Protein-glutamate methylesterase/protein-glutamine glutaminase n=1 Tax=Desulfuribacillus alkaliarsenatis TaxID=766136 RepID=A0A1E5FZ92_9FIRM|nr:chemotaxis response regulator protein-glutamate methylesterase [Desulfuribacillus alkaliarsenatis]OEF95822.1 hypothetical protein BHF68_10515 [Desulfuribacillus alkaliarsenatis]
MVIARVLIIDDSALVRNVLKTMLEKDPEIEVVGWATDPIHAIKVIKEVKPNVLTLDLEMPKMDGLTFLGKLMKIVPLPVVIISSKAERGSEATIRGLELGAIDFVTKPAISVGSGLKELEHEIVEKVKQAAAVDREKLRKLHKAPILKKASETDGQASNYVELPATSTQSAAIKSTDKIIAIGASTGGTVAVRAILEALPSNLPPIVIVLHMPAGFTKSYAQGLNKQCRMNVKEAEDREPLKFGYAYIASGGKHTKIHKSGFQYEIRLTDDPPYNRHRPSVDVTFLSIAEHAGGNVMGAILTGMGGDGAKGLKELHDLGAYTIVQDEKSSIVYGMPKQAISLGAVKEVVALDAIPKKIIDYIIN